ncbi:MAG: amidohydrolase family protein, partial [bacterium]
MIIDAHTHTFPEKICDSAVSKLEAAARMRAWVRGTPAALEESMEEAGVDYAVNLPVATHPGQPHRLNLAAIAMNETGHRLLSFGAMHPDDPNWREELDFIAAHGIRGIKLHPMYQGVDLDDIRSLRILGGAAERGLCVTVHAGEDIGIPGPSRCSPRHVLRALRETGIDKLILAHMGGWNLWEEVRRELAGAPVYF